MTKDEMLDEIEQYVRSCVDNNTGMPAMDIIGSKWLMRILFHLCRRSPLRFGEIKRIIPDISNAALSSSLHSLQDNGLISRKQFNELPLRVEYSITEAGVELMKLDHRIITWERTYCRSKRPD
ncbi:MAG: helix-turn-helix transcriptional regulator [Oscillospiraceae bacterium]|nr:helix-turn-helix transcriptional regulator [Oscillospiraceae bacterium]